MQTYSVPPQPHFTSIFISQATSKCVVMGYRGHVTELSTGMYADV